MLNDPATPKTHIFALQSENVVTGWPISGGHLSSRKNKFTCFYLSISHFIPSHHCREPQGTVERLGYSWRNSGSRYPSTSFSRKCTFRDTNAHFGTKAHDFSQLTSQHLNCKQVSKTSRQDPLKCI